MLRQPGEDAVVEVIFEQDYRSDGYADTTRKRQYWTKEDGRWKIIYEGDA